MQRWWDGCRAGLASGLFSWGEMAAGEVRRVRPVQPASAIWMSGVAGTGASGISGDGVSLRFGVVEVADAVFDGAGVPDLVEGLCCRNQRRARIRLGCIGLLGCADGS